MTPASSVAEEIVRPSDAGPRSSAVLFRSLVLTEQESHAGRAGVTVITSVLLHAVLIITVAVLPLLYYDAIPSRAPLRTFFVTPLEVVPPPPPPPPPAAATRPVAKPVSEVDAQPTEGFVAPIDVPTEIVPEEGLDLGIEGGVPGGVEGGVPGGVVGGVVGGLPQDAPPPAVKAVRVGGMIVRPKKLKDVAPVYPSLAQNARVQGMVILEATVSPQGKVSEVKVLRGHPLLEGAAVGAVKQWVYTPTLLNGVPVPVIMVVTVSFTLA